MPHLILAKRPRSCFNHFLINNASYFSICLGKSSKFLYVFWKQVLSCTLHPSILEPLASLLPYYTLLVQLPLINNHSDSHLLLGWCQECLSHFCDSECAPQGVLLVQSHLTLMTPALWFPSFITHPFITLSHVSTCVHILLP